MGQKRLPWFKVQCRLADNIKFRQLSPTLKGHLLCLWCCASAQTIRGKLPNVREIAYYLGENSFLSHIERVEERVLKPLTVRGFLDFNATENAYYIHDWEHWQNIPSDSEEKVEIRPFTRPNARPNIRLAVESDVENKGVKPIIQACRSIDGKIIDETVVSSTLKPLRNEHKTAKNNGHDERYLPLKSFMEEKYREYRGMSLGSATKQSDWVQVAAMLKRSRSDMQFSISNLQQSFLQWLTGSPKWEREQSIGWWASNAHRFIGNRTLQSVKPQRVYRPTIDDSADLEWWKHE